MTVSRGSYFRAGDILAFWGAEFSSWKRLWATRASAAIEIGTYITTGPWLPMRLPPSHVGIIAEFDGDHLLVESTTMGTHPCVQTGKLHNGVQVQWPLTRIEDYKGRCEVWRPLPLWTLSKGESGLLSKICADHFIGRKVDYDMLRAMISGTHAFYWLGNPDPYKAFCSELVYALLDRLGKLPGDNPAKFNPARLLRIIRRLGRYQRLVSHWINGQPYFVS